MAAEASRAAPFDAAQLLDSLSTAVVVVDDRPRILHLNVAAEVLLATSLGAARGRRLADFVAAGDRLESLIVRARVGGESLVQREWELVPVLRSDARYLVDCVFTPLVLAAAPGAVLAEISDTTRQARISRENALLAQLGGSRMMARQLAHEIKNPLGGLRGAAQLLERELPDESLREYTRVIIGEADRLRALVDSLLGPPRALRRESVNVHELLDHVYRLVRAEAPEAVAIVRDYDPSLPSMQLDRDQVIQAMLNLARNAVQALGNHGQLVLRSRALTGANIGERRHRVVASIQFEDNGPGVPPELGETIFYPLVTAQPGGTGLGLAVAQDIATRHDGLVEFESRPGRTVFSLLLPIGTTHEQTA
ncbi:MAG: two-component system, NtrC family, nitrogen regulation sensor histidine kinase GlnL [Proteobacteria bacterium]|nr:two-component system, NtrC family, nitrogen regulation sensor histidine kinase GlnL [Pseudomonadota bacterium]